MKILNLPLLLFFCICHLTHSVSQPAVVFTAAQSGFNSPVDIANAGDGTDRLFIVERSGVIKIIQGSTTLVTPFLDISSDVGCCGERGLLGLAFHPNYASNGYFFVNYTDNNGDTQISRFSVNPSDANLALPASELSILKIDQPFGNHNAGDLNFGPLDGYLYIAMGDGGSGGDPGDRSQDPACLLGKVLRIDINGAAGSAGSDSQTGACGFENEKNYTIPPTNPFVGTPAVLDEIWSIGWRNPWRFSFDPMNGDLWVADVGQDDWEEVSLESSGNGGGNYGWRCYEGNHAYNTTGCSPQSAYIDAVFEYGHNSSGGYSITGGCVYRGSQFPNMQGHYIPIALIEFTGSHKNGFNQLIWSTASAVNSDRFEIEKSTDAQLFQKIGEVATANASEVREYSFTDQSGHAANNYYRLKLIDRDGSYSYSSTIIINVPLPFGLAIFPNPTDGFVDLNISKPLKTTLNIQVIDINGKVMLEKNVSGGTQKASLDLTDLANNVYFIRATTADFVLVERIVVE